MKGLINGLTRLKMILINFLFFNNHFHFSDIVTFLYMKKILLLFLFFPFISFSQDTDGDGINDDVDNCPQVSNGPSIEGTTIAGGSWIGSGANQLDRPRYIAVHGNGDLYISDYENNRIQKWAPGATEGITVAGGNGSGSAANQIRWPRGCGI